MKINLAFALFLSVAPWAGAQLSLLPGDAVKSAAAGEQARPAIARGNTVSLAVWDDSRANPYGSYDYETSRDIYGVRLDAAGNSLDPVPLAIVAGRASQTAPKVAWNGANWLVVYQSVDVGGTGYYQDSLQAVRVAPNGQVLDGEPIKLHGLIPLGPSYWALASDGNNWVVVNESTPTSSDIVAVRVSAAGVLLDPPTRALVPGTYYLRSNVQLAYAGGVFLCTFNDTYNNGVDDTKAVRFDSNLTSLDVAPISFLPSPVSSLAGNGAGFYAVWNRQEPDFSVHVVGSRVNTGGARVDGNGVNLSGTRQPYSGAAAGVTWDGLNWRVTWGESATSYVARITSAGVVLDPGSVPLPGLPTGVTAGINGALQVAATVYANNNNDVITYNVSSGNVPGSARPISIGAPQQWRPDVATSGNGYLVTYLSSTAAGSRLLVQALDAAGNPLSAEPVELARGNVGAPSVAWNGSGYLVSWGTSEGIVAQRLLPNGATLDPAPFLVMAGCFGPADVAALGSDFLISGRKIGSTPQYVFPVAARVSGAGVVLDLSPLIIGGSYLRTAPAVVALGGRWLVAWHQNATHDNSYCISMGVFVPPTGTAAAPFQIHGPFSTAGGNGIFEVGLASSGDVALFVQSQEITSGVENDMLCRLIDASGVVGPVTNLTPWAGNQYRPRVAWDGASFIIAYQDQRNRLAVNTLDPIDARSDLFAMRVSPAGTVLDPQGFVFSALPTAETDPTVCALNNTVLLAGALMVNDTSYANYRIAYDIIPGNGPIAALNASTTAGDIPLTVDFDSGSHFGAPLSYAWDFGDGTTSPLPKASHTFTVAGEYLVRLTVSDELGRQTTLVQMVQATRSNQVPVASATASRYSGNAPLDVVLSAAQSYDPDGVIGNIEWRFSDGGMYYGATAYHTFSTVGIHTVTLLCYDSRGGIGTTNLTIAIGDVNQPPVAVAGAMPTAGTAPLIVQFSSAGSSDPDGSIIAYEWTFGDAFGTHSNEPNPTYRYDYAGTYTATLTVWDNNNVSRSANVIITVAPTPATNLRCSAINLSGKLQGNKVSVSGNVAVVNGTGSAVGGATVSVTWTKPGGATVLQTATTGANGIAKFSTSGARGTFTLTVNSVVKSGYTFDAANSILSNSITK